MLACNTNPIKCNFVRSYDDLVGKPSINGVTLEGNISFDDLGLSEWLEEATENFLTTSELDTKLAGYIKSESNGINPEGFVIEYNDDSFRWSANISSYGMSFSNYSIDFGNKFLDASSEFISIANSSTYNSVTLSSDGFSMATISDYTTLDAATLQALISLL